MHRTKKNPNISSADNIQHFRQSFLAALNKLNDTATKQLGLDDIHNILSQQAQGPEYISLVLHLLSENDEHQKVGARRETLKVIGIMAEVFENKILEFFPKILSLVTKKLKENNPQIHDSLSDAMGSVIGFGLRKLPPEEACRNINSALRTFYSLSESSNKYTQMGSAMCIYKIIQCSPVECLYFLTEELSERLADLLHSPGCKAQLQIFECILSLILGIEDNSSKLKICSRILLPVVIDNLANLDWNVRKIAVDVVYTISVLLKGAIAPKKQELLTALNHCKFDKIRNVRDITATTINFLKSIPDVPTPDADESAVSPLIPSRGEERSKTKEAKEGVVYVSFGKSDPTLKTMLEKPQRPGGDLGMDDLSQQKGGVKSKNNREINPNFFKNAPKDKGDVEIFSKGANTKNQEWVEPPKQAGSKSQADLPRGGLESTKGQAGSTKRIDKNPPIVDKHPVVTDFLEDAGGLRPASAQKKSRPEEAVHSHRRQASEHSDYVLSAKLSQNKTDLIARKKESVEATKNIPPPLGAIETPSREAFSGSRLQNPDSAILSSPQGLFADDFANLSRQLKKINKQQTQLIESVSSFQNTTQTEIASLKNRMGALEDFVQRIYQAQKDSYHYAPSPTQYPSSPGYNYPMQPYNGVYSHQYPPGAFRDAYLQNPAQSVDLHDQMLRQRNPASSYQGHDTYNRYMPSGGIPQGTYQNLSSGLAESGHGKQKNEKSNVGESKERHQDLKSRDLTDTLHKDAWATKTRKSSTWVKVEELLKKGHVGEAYAVCVGQGDEESVIKLMRETGVVVHLLSELVVEEVLGIIDKKLFEPRDRGLVLDWIEISLDTKSLSSPDQLMKLNEILAQVLGDNNLTTGEYQRVGKLKSELGALLSQDENSDTEERHKKRI